MYHWVGLLLIQLCTCFLSALGYKYEGVKFERGNCGVSIMRSGEFKPAVPRPPSQILLLVTAGIQARVQSRHTAHSVQNLLTSRLFCASVHSDFSSLRL